MRPRWEFELIRGTRIAIAVLGVMGIAWGMRELGDFWEEYEPMWLWKLGEVGRQLIVEDFPYLVVLIGVLVGVVTTAVTAKVGKGYRMSWWIRLGGIIVMAMVAGVVVIGKIRH